MVLNLSAKGIAEQGLGLEPQRKNNWFFLISPPGSNADALVIELKSCSFPKLSITPGEQKVGNETRKFPSAGKLDTISIVYVDYTNGEASKAFTRWSNQIRNPRTGEIANKATAVTDATLLLFDTQGGTKRKWKFHGCWPSLVDLGEGSMGDSKDNEVKVTLEVDWFELVA